MEYSDVLRGIAFIVISYSFVAISLAAHRPIKFLQMMDESGGWTAYVRVFAPLIGYYVVAFLAFRWSLGFLPNAWGSADGDGNFVYLTDSLAGAFAFPAMIAVASAVAHAGKRDARALVSSDKINGLEQEIKAARYQTAKISDELADERAAHERTKGDLAKANLTLRDETRRLSRLIDPAVLAEEERKRQERMSAPPIVYRG